VNGEAKISLLVLNDDIRVHSRGTMMTIVHRLRTTWETAVAAFCPAVVDSGRAVVVVVVIA
jgi:hypothetical protein